MDIQILNIKDLLDELDEGVISNMFSSFSCPMNRPIEHFLRDNAVDFAKRGISITYLVVAVRSGQIKILGYFSLANKMIELNRGKLSRTTEKLVQRFSDLNTTTNTYSLSAPLIAQFGKNYSEGLNKQISGKELMSLALTQVKSIQKMIGGRAVYLECEDNAKLYTFYTSLGYTEFDKRYTNSENESPFYHQLMRFLK